MCLEKKRKWKTDLYLLVVYWGFEPTISRMRTERTTLILIHHIINFFLYLIYILYNIFYKKSIKIFSLINFFLLSYIYYIIFFIKNQIKYNNFEIVFMFISLKLIYCGAPRRTRTFVTLVNNNQQLCQLSYRGKNSGGTSPLLVDPGHSTSPNIIENLFLIR